jgi:glycosyltransferase involved in cell wall biosynthesis
MSVLVAQLGARRHYAVPRALHAHGRLATFCTDVFLASPGSRAIAGAAAGATGHHALRRLAGRSASELPAKKVKTFPSFALAYYLRSRAARNGTAQTANWLWGGEHFCRRAIGHLDDQCGAVFAFSSAAKELLACARARGLRTILDHATAPRRFEMGLVAEEMQRFPGWLQDLPSDPLMEAYQQRQLEEIELADVVLCGSSYARRAIAGDRLDGAKFRVVPLGYDAPAAREVPLGANDDGKLHVLFVGNEGLRKGIGYLAEAVTLLGSPTIEARAVGKLGLTQAGMAALGRSLDLVGALPRASLRAQIEWAHVVVLPSISDTFGLVILEAMASGLPVITTANSCGPDILREGADGFIVPIRDAEQIADRLDRLASDRALLRDMGRSARSQAQKFTLQAYGRALVRGTE